MPVKLCHHIKADGILCRSAALHGRHYCFFHLTHRAQRVRIAQHRRRNQPLRLELPPLEDLNSVQLAIMQVMDAIVDGRLERHEAGHLLYGLQTAGNFLRGKERVCFEVSPAAESRCVAYDSLEEDFELEDDEVSPGDDAATAAAAAGPQAATAAPAAADPGGGPVAGKKATESESGKAEASAHILIDRIMAVADDRPADSPPGADTASLEEPPPKKQPRALRPPKAIRQSAEDAAALAKEQQAAGPECGRLDTGEIILCRDCEVKIWKRMAQYWEGTKRPPDWLPTRGTIDCLDCQLKHLKTLGQHLDDKTPWLFDCYFKLNDLGLAPADFDHYFWKMKDSIDKTGQMPEDWQEALRNWTPGCGDAQDVVEVQVDVEEGEASA